MTHEDETAPTDTASGGAAPRQDRFAVAALLTLLVAFGPMSTDLYLPALPSIVAHFDSDVPTVQLTLSVFLVGFAVAQLLYGPLSDRFGRRPVILGGIVIFTLSSIACALAPTVEALIAARFCQAVGACCGPVLGRAVVRDIYGRDRAATVLAYMAMAMGVAPAIGPVVGGILTSWFGWTSNFWLLTGFGGAMLTATMIVLAESNRYLDPTATQPARLLRNYRTLLSHRPYLVYVAIVACLYSGIFSFISGSSYVFIDGLGLTPTQFGLCFASIVVGYMMGSFVAGRVSSRLGVDRMLAIGLSVCLAGAAPMVVLAATGVFTIMSVIVPFFVFMVGVALSLPNAMAGAVGPFPRMAGLASSLLGFFQMGTAAIVGIGVGLFTDGSPLPMAAAVFAVALIAAAARAALSLFPAPLDTGQPQDAEETATRNG
ncbi:multidrug effflux MFS transporter [Fodinicurvata sp. EGI_FJ10296]|uniref:multidrug effflux MFS transporter n=1 Tax=Fodinicurvata sp. EGI_FJ10296 TaxID=3231908 RepID=UPI0034512327